MISGCGTDLVAVARLEPWQKFTDKQLFKVFVPEELLAIRADGTWSSQRAAAYFALKEAFYKALSNAMVATQKIGHDVSFQQICPLICIQKNSWGIPEISVDWQAITDLTGFSQQWQVHCSYSHERDYAIAFVVLSQ